MSLGRGLGALITPTGKNNLSTVIADEGKVWFVPLSKVTADPNQPRKNFDQDELNQLAASIKEHGVLQPILVVEKNDGGYELVAGERRWRASHIAGMTTIPALIKKLADQQKVEISLIENIQRQDLDPIEEAFAYKRLMEEFDLTQQQVADKVGKSRPAVANAVRLLDLPVEVQAALVDRKINSGQARALLSLSTPQEQLDMLASMMGEKITVREIEREANKQKVLNHRPIRKDANLLFLEDKLRAEFGTKVNITQKGDRGTIVVDYYSQEELKRVVKKLLGE
ncbi:MAG: ParB/RepB/Spo0J family partition protein [Candidatus Magasanikbacteria bacterium]|nr:ParB/RepB/Spo0J family partition protein [Candidatus Magasanikbacteria bacterium]